MNPLDELQKRLWLHSLSKKKFRKETGDKCFCCHLPAVWEPCPECGEEKWSIEYVKKSLGDEFSPNTNEEVHLLMWVLMCVPIVPFALCWAILWWMGLCDRIIFDGDFILNILIACGLTSGILSVIAFAGFMTSFKTWTKRLLNAELHKLLMVDDFAKTCKCTQKLIIKRIDRRMQNNINLQEILAKTYQEAFRKNLDANIENSNIIENGSV